jgi:molybdopterin biosynthesis enzyme
MLAVPDAQEVILQHTEPLPCQRVPFQRALDHTLAEEVTAAEPVPGFRASIKVRSRPNQHQSPAATHQHQQV